MDQPLHDREVAQVVRFGAMQPRLAASDVAQSLCERRGRDRVLFLAGYMSEPVIVRTKG